MHDDLKKVLGPKKAINPMEKEAKLDALKAMKKAAGSVMADEFKNMNKVTVAAPDTESLKMGLEKAEDVVDQAEDLEPSESEESEAELPESVEEIDALMQKLMEKKLALKSEE
jgi:translation initiation factor IF-2